MPNDSDALTPITAHPLSRVLHAKYYTFLFTVYCYRLFRSANRSLTMCQPVRLDGRFQESKSGNLLHSVIVASKSRLCRYLTELGAFRFRNGQFAEWTLYAIRPLTERMDTSTANGLVILTSCCSAEIDNYCVFIVSIRNLLRELTERCKFRMSIIYDATVIFLPSLF